MSARVTSPDKKQYGHKHEKMVQLDILAPIDEDLSSKLYVYV